MLRVLVTPFVAAHCAFAFILVNICLFWFAATPADPAIAKGMAQLNCASKTSEQKT